MPHRKIIGRARETLTSVGDRVKSPRAQKAVARGQELISKVETKAKGVHQRLSDTRAKGEQRLAEAKTRIPKVPTVSRTRPTRPERPARPTRPDFPPRPIRTRGRFRT